jgi:hypothetical protein
MRMGKYVEEIDQVLLQRKRDDAYRKESSRVPKDVEMGSQQLPMPFMGQDASHAWLDVFRDW